MEIRPDLAVDGESKRESGHKTGHFRLEDFRIKLQIGDRTELESGLKSRAALSAFRRFREFAGIFRGEACGSRSTSEI